MAGTQGFAHIRAAPAVNTLTDTPQQLQPAETSAVRTAAHTCAYCSAVLLMYTLPAQPCTSRLHICTWWTACSMYTAAAQLPPALQHLCQHRSPCRQALEQVTQHSCFTAAAKSSKFAYPDHVAWSSTAAQLRQPSPAPALSAMSCLWRVCSAAARHRLGFIGGPWHEGKQQLHLVRFRRWTSHPSGAGLKAVAAPGCPRGGGLHTHAPG
jgi:hypothetical protein